MGWITQQAETELLFEDGSVYPQAVIATVYEENELGEKRLLEQKTFSLQEKETVDERA